MRMTIPAKFSEITLEKYLAYHTAKTATKKLAELTGVPESEVRKLTPAAIADLIATVDQVMELKTATHVKIVTHEGVHYGFIPDLTSMSYGEHADLALLAGEIWGERKNISLLPDLMAIMYRPITMNVGDKYEIKEYDSNKQYHKGAMMTLSMDKVQGALLFFSSIRTKLLNASLPFLEAEMKKMLKENEELLSTT